MVEDDPVTLNVAEFGGRSDDPVILNVAEFITLNVAEFGVINVCTVELL